MNYNSNNNELAAGLGNVLVADGQRPMTGNLKLTDGTSTNPGISFNSEASTGVFRPSAASLGITIGAVEALRISPNRNLLLGTVGDTGERLIVVGPSRLTGDTAITGVLGVSGVTTLASSLGVTGATTLNSTLGVVGNTTMTGALGVTAGVAFASTLTVAGALGVSGATSLAGFGASGNGTVGGTFGALGAATFGSTLSSGSQSIVGNISATGTITAPNYTGTASAATLAAKASTLASGGGNGTAMTFSWSGQSGTPAYAWGSNDGVNHYPWQPGNWSVNYANGSGYASNAGTVGGQSFPYTNPTNQPTYLWASNGSNNNFLVQPTAMAVNFANSCSLSNNTNSFQGAAPGYFVNNGNSAVVNMRNDGSTGLRVGIGGYGDVVWNVYGSDERLKENIVPSAQDSLALIKAIDFKSFQYKVLNPGTSEEWHIDDGHVHEHGVIAQQIQGLNAEWVNTEGTYLQPNVDTLLFSALKAIKQLEARLAAAGL
ncbi:tail fiber domain-containing protein [Variovorax sp. LG9.2]|nr:tail fiber domain-containing protein [Variovorax sp. LG9.2]